MSFPTWASRGRSPSGALAVVGLVAIAYLIMQRRRPRYVARFTNVDLLANIVARRPRWRRHVPPALTLLALSALVVGLARPEMAVAVPREEATVILAMDSSGSMTATDVAPDRMAVARDVAGSFVEDLPEDFQVGVVSFSDQADVIVPPTADRDEAVRALERLEADNGTALGDAIARSVELGISNLDEDEQPAEGESPGDRARPLRRRQHDRRLRAARGGPGGGRREGARCTPSRSAPRRARSRARTATAERERSPCRRTRDPDRGRRDDGRPLLRGGRRRGARSVYDEIGSQVGTEQEQRELTVIFTGRRRGAAALRRRSLVPSGSRGSRKRPPRRARLGARRGAGAVERVGPSATIASLASYAQQRVEEQWGCGPPTDEGRIETREESSRVQ